MNTAWVPVDACTLPTAEQPLRADEFDRLFAETLLGVRRVAPTHVVLTLAPGSADRARDLVARESSCCSFFSFEITEGDPVTLEITVPLARAGVLDGLVARTEAAR
jgi:arsenate reductase